MTGYIYCLTNTSYPGLVKIGKTQNDPEARAAQLSSSTSVPTQFDIAWSQKVANMDAAETALHDALRNYRVNQRREFFKCRPFEALAHTKRLPAFQSPRASHTPHPNTKFAKSESKLGLSLAAMMVLMFLATCQFDWNAQTTVIGTTVLAALLTAFFWTTGMTRMIRDNTPTA